MTTGAGIDDGSGVLLRPAEPSDAERWLEMIRDSECQKYGSPAFVDVPTDVAGLADRIESSRTAWAEGSPGTFIVAAVEAPERFLGDIGWRWSLHEKFAAADLGYSVHPDARGRGVGRRAIVALTRWLLAPDGRGLDRVQLDHSTENPASCRVALAAGFEREGIRRGYLPLRDLDGTIQRHDVCLHGTITPPA